MSSRKSFAHSNAIARVRQELRLRGCGSVWRDIVILGRTMLSF